MKLRKRLPTRLKQEPLVEALWEIRFTSEHPAASELLTGIIFQQMKADFGKSDRLPVANMPREVRERDANLRYAPTVRLTGSRYTVGIGDQAIGLSSLRPYTGWKEFRAKIDELLSTIEQSGVIGKCKSFSIKYVDCIGSATNPSLDVLAINVGIADRKFASEPMAIRTEFHEMGYLHILQIGLPAEVSVVATKETLRGVIMEVDTHCTADAEIDNFHHWISARLDGVHAANKTVFFSILSDDTIKRLEPIYGEEP